MVRMVRIFMVKIFMVRIFMVRILMVRILRRTTNFVKCFYHPPGGILLTPWYNFVKLKSGSYGQKKI